jgi:hypothetical protein
MKKILTCVSLCILTLTGCAEFEESPIAENENVSAFKTTRTTTQYQINPDNPYSLANVQEALDEIEGADAPELTATDIYVRFLPQDTTDMYILVDSLDLDIFPYPLDYDLTLAEMEAHENTLINGYAWQYCLVPPDFQMPSEMESEFLDYAYLQSEYPGTRDIEDQLDLELYDLVIDAAFENTGNAPPATRAGNNHWAPSATIKYQSDVDGEAVIPLENVRVRVNTFFNSGEGYTDEYGNVTISGGWGGKFKNAVQYKIIWSTDLWKIHDGSGKVKYEGPKQREAWDDFVIDGSDSSKEAMCATIHRALNAYYHESHLKTNGLVKRNYINVRVRLNEAGENGSLGNFGKWRYNEIHIFSHSDENSPTHRALSTTFHELGHASHLQAIIDQPGMNRQEHFKNTYIKETWARGVQYAYMSSLYPDNFIGTFNYFADPTPDGPNSPDDYTAIIESLMNQGITLAQLQNIFMGKIHLSQCIQPVKDLEIVPDAIVDMIFDNPYTPVRVNLVNPISGPSNPALNEWVTYTVPAHGLLPTGMTFEGFEVSGTIYDRSYSQSTGGNLNVTFKTATLHTITATYTLPDDTEYTVTKTINLTQPSPLATPTITANKTQLTSYSESVTFSVTSPQSGMTYEWQSNGSILANQTGTSLTLTTPNGPGQPIPPAGPPIINPLSLAFPGFSVRCRAVNGSGVTSAWSNLITVPFYEPAINNSI